MEAHDIDQMVTAMAAIPSPEVLYIPRQAYEAMLAIDNPSWPQPNACPLLFRALVNQKRAEHG